MFRVEHKAGRSNTNVICAQSLIAFCKEILRSTAEGKYDVGLIRSICPGHTDQGHLLTGIARHKMMVFSGKAGPLYSIIFGARMIACHRLPSMRRCGLASIIPNLGM